MNDGRFRLGMIAGAGAVFVGYAIAKLLGWA
jgi:hypothetical protein